MRTARGTRQENCEASSRKAFLVAFLAALLHFCFTKGKPLSRLPVSEGGKHSPEGRNTLPSPPSGETGQKRDRIGSWSKAAHSGAGPHSYRAGAGRGDCPKPGGFTFSWVATDGRRPPLGTSGGWNRCYPKPGHFTFSMARTKGGAESGAWFQEN